jgi:hypothetical protein
VPEGHGRKAGMTVGFGQDSVDPAVSISAGKDFSTRGLSFLNTNRIFRGWMCEVARHLRRIARRIRWSTQLFETAAEICTQCC